MGCSASVPNEELARRNQEDSASRRIEEEQKQAQHEYTRTWKILLLGASDCGKSTILRQFRLLHGKSFTDEERQHAIIVVRDNIVSSILLLVDSCEFYGLSIENEEVLAAIDRIRAIAGNVDNVDILIPDSFCRDFVLVYRHESIQKVLESRSEIQLLDSADYFFDEVPRIMSTGFIPTDNDILHSRVMTNGVKEFKFDLADRKISFFDVGGQRGERRKWIRCFENVSALLFVGALSEYDQSLLEDSSVNRMIESVQLFHGVVSLPCFAKTHVILFLNKYDLLEKKITSRKRDLKTFFPHYRGIAGGVYEAELFIRRMYREALPLDKKNVYVHVTNAFDSTKFAAIWLDIQDIIVGKAMLGACLT